MLKLESFSVCLLACFCLTTAYGQTATPEQSTDRRAAALKDDVPHIVCLSSDYATGAQPGEQAYPKLAAAGFRSVLNLRTATEGVDLEKERELVERAGLRYINIPVVSKAPTDAQADQFLAALKKKENHPVLIHCATANRVGAFWMIHRVLDDGWSEEKAFDEATLIGLKSPHLKDFALAYIAQHRQK